MTAWTPICHVDDIPRLGARRVARAQGLDVAIFRSADDQIFALLDACPHKGGPLSQGIVHGKSVTCPMHGWNLELATGCATAPDEGCARKYETRLESGEVHLNLA